MKKNLLVFLLALIPLFGLAEVVSEGQAHDAAARFFAQGNARYSRSSEASLKLVWNGTAKVGRSTLASAPAFYVFNRGDNQGFVIVSGENAVRPILAYAYEGTFGTDAMPENLKGWMRQVEQEIMAVRTQQLQPSSATEAAWNQLRNGKVMAHLETPWWNQNKPFNSKCPGYSNWEDWHAYVGCTMTATAIVMGYHQWPDQPVGELSGYTTNGLGVWVEGVNLSDHRYRWEKMPDINGNILPYDENSAEYKDQEDAISTLMRDLGVMLRANYDFSGTSASLSRIPWKIVQHQKYQEGVFYVERKYFTDDGWRKILTHEIDHNRPIVYAGFGSTRVGHAFVLDGYDDEGRFSVNWGWGGTSNGYFDINSMDPANQGIGGSNGGYSDGQEAVLRLLPAREGDVYEDYEYITYTETNYVEKGLRLLDSTLPVVAGEPFWISAGRYCNLSTRAYQGHFQIAVTNSQGMVKEVLFTSPLRDFKPGDATMPLNENRDKVEVTIQHPIVAGDRIRMIYLSADGTWKPVVSEDPNAPWEILLKAEQPEPVSIEVKTTAGRNLNGRAIATFSASVPTIPSDASVEVYYAEQKDNQTIMLRKYTAHGPQLVVPAHTGVVLATAGEKTFTMTPATADGNNVPLSNLLQPTSDEATDVDPGVSAYILAKHSENVLFHLLSATDRKVAAHRAYLELPATLPTANLNVVFEGETTGIGDHHMEVGANAPVFDLTGRRVHHPAKGGIYIKNGKKIIIK